MIEVKLESSIIAFDGRVVETFAHGQTASRYHVAHVKTAELKSDKKGRQSLQIFMHGGGGLATAPLPPEALAQAQQLLAELEQARASL